MKNLLKKIILILCILFMSLSVYAANPYNIMEYKKGIYVVEINTDKTNYELRPYFVEGLESNSDVYELTKAKLVVNGGFFDPKNKKTVSYVVIGGKTVLDPKQNENLMGNRNLKPYMDKILNRSEFRILRNSDNKIVYDIAFHNEEIPDGMELLHSIQAGPMLYPQFRLEEEFFILVKNGELKSESASSLRKYARTGIGIKGNKVYILIVTKDAPLTLKELRDIAVSYGMEKAMALDGGGSTSLDCNDLHILSDYDNQGRKLKSFLILQKVVKE